MHFSAPSLNMPSMNETTDFHLARSVKKTAAEEPKLEKYYGDMTVINFNNFQRSLEPKLKAREIWKVVRRQNHTKLGTLLAQYQGVNLDAALYFGSGHNVEARFNDFRARRLNCDNNGAYCGSPLDKFAEKTGMLFLPLGHLNIGHKHVAI